MSKKIVVDPQKLKDAATAIDTVISDYKSIYTALFSNVSKLSTTWKGTDNLTFTTQIEGFKDDFEKMAKLMEDYSSFLKTSSSTYQAAQDEIVAAAKKLTN